MSDPSFGDLISAASQDQFLTVIGRDEALARFQRHLRLDPLPGERVPLTAALDRTLSADVVADVDVPGFDRSNVDGFAVRSADTVGAAEEAPRTLRLNREVLAPAIEPQIAVQPGTATPISTGGMLPRGADCVLMIEDSEIDEQNGGGAAGSQPLSILVRRAVPPGQSIAFAGSDVAKGETILRAGQLLTSREIGVLAAIGRAEIEVVRRPRVAIFSTGDEIVAPGTSISAGRVYDSNQFILAAAVTELGGEPVLLGVVPDDERRLEDRLRQALGCDVVLLSGGTSKGPGDLSYRVVTRLVKDPGVVVHGVSLKPGKPICLAVTDGKPVVILPGFPASAIFTFHEFAAPVIRALAGRPRDSQEDTVEAVLPLRINSERGRTEYALVNLVRGEQGLAAYPMAKGSGSVTTFSGADGFVTIPQQTEIVEAGSTVRVRLIDRTLRPADLVAIGSHCIGLDLLLGRLQRAGWSTKALFVGSTAGLAAAKRGECDLAGMHLFDPESGRYNEPFLTQDLELIRGYRRMQMLVFRRGDARFEGRSPRDAARAAARDPACAMVNRNPGSGTRILIDRLLEGARPPGYAVQARSHNAVATAIVQGRADWGVAIEPVARLYELSGIPLQEEHYDFAVPKSRLDRPAVRAFRELLGDEDVREALAGAGLQT
jgi:putative molybdopterin biosynthesis protein